MLSYTLPAVVRPAADVDVHHVALEGAVRDELLVALVALVAHLVVRLHAVAAVLAVPHDGHAAVVALEAEGVAWQFDSMFRTGHRQGNQSKMPFGYSSYANKLST